MREVNDNAEGLIILNFPHICNVQKIIIFDKTNYINRHVVEGISLLDLISLEVLCPDAEHSNLDK